MRIMQITGGEQIEEISKITSYTTLKHHIETNPLPHLMYERDIIMSKSDKSMLDYVSLHHLSSDAPDSFAPVSVLGMVTAFAE